MNTCSGSRGSIAALAQYGKMNMYSLIYKFASEIFHLFRTTLKGEEAACEALRKAKFKFPGRQLVYVSRNWGFTPYPKEVFQEGRVSEVEWRGKASVFVHGSLGRTVFSCYDCLYIVAPINVMGLSCSGATGRIVADGVTTKFISGKGVRLSKQVRSLTLTFRPCFF